MALRSILNAKRVEPTVETLQKADSPQSGKMTRRQFLVAFGTAAILPAIGNKSLGKLTPRPNSEMTGEVGLAAMEAERKILGPWVKYDWAALEVEYTGLIAVAAAEYKKRYQKAPVTDEEQRQAMAVIMTYLYVDKKFEWFDASLDNQGIALMSQAVFEKKLDCDIACRFYMDFLRAICVPASDTGLMVMAVGPNQSMGHVMLGLGENFFDPQPMDFDGLSYKIHMGAKTEVLKAYPSFYLAGANSHFTRDNWGGMIDLIESQSHKMQEEIELDVSAYKLKPDRALKDKVNAQKQRMGEILKVGVELAGKNALENSRCPSAWFQLGDLQYLQADYDPKINREEALSICRLAIQSYQNCLLAEPKFWGAAIEISRIYEMAFSDHEKAIEYSKKALENMSTQLPGRKAEEERLLQLQAQTPSQRKH